MGCFGRTLRLLAACCVLGGCARAPLPTPASILPPRSPPDDRVHVAAQPYARFGKTSGYLQTPRGGAPGSTSPRRPTLSEIGATDGREFGAQVRVRWRRHQGKLEVSRLLMHGGATLQDDLVSQASAFPAGTRVDSDSDLTFLGAGYSYLFELPVGAQERLELRPGAGFRGVRVHYVLDGSNGAGTSRTYTSYAPNVELDVAWRPRGRGNLLLSGHVGQSIDTFHHERRRMSVFETSGRIHYELGRRASLFLEVGYRHTLLDDIQPLQQNRIHTDFGPWVGIGAHAGF